MKFVIIAASIVTSVALCLICARSVATQDKERMINPGTRLASDALRLLRSARAADHLNSQSWGSSNPSLGHYYSAKVVEIDRLIDDLAKGRSVCLEAVERALDNRGAREFGGRPWTLPDRLSL
jgi:hypothetical protein